MPSGRGGLKVRFGNGFFLLFAGRGNLVGPHRLGVPSKREMIAMLLWQVYVCGALIAAASTSVAADLFSEPDVPAATRAGAIVFAGALWPVLLVGLLQFAGIGVLAQIIRRNVSQPLVITDKKSMRTSSPR
jgi:hypothetical protein